MGDLMFNEFLDNVILMILCYAYILLVIFVQARMERFARASTGSSVCSD